MYKIYINETPLILIQEANLAQAPANDAQNLVGRYPDNPKYLFAYIDMLEKSQRFNSVTVFSANYERLVQDFENLFKIIEAAGGVVENEVGEVLAIFRRNSWDLPKGKIDPGESKEEAAVREVQEETGIQEVSLGDFIVTTHHTYRTRKKKRVLKRTYWYKMRTTDTELTPQEEEDIEQAIWISIPDLLQQNAPIYNNIKAVLNHAKTQP